MTTATRQNII